MIARVVHGDCLLELPQMDADSFHACVTDPPYNLGFMGKKWDGDVATRPETWAEVLRVLKPGAHLLAFGGTRTSHRMAVAIEDAGFEIRDTLMWLYGSGFPKSHDVGKGIDRAAGAEREVVGVKADPRYLSPRRNSPNHMDRERGVEGGHGEGSAAAILTAPATPEAAQWSGWGTALKPAWEPIILARKPLIGTVAANVLAHGCGALNIDASRIQVTGQRPAANMAAWERDQNPCDLCAVLAAQNEKLETPGIKASSVTRRAGQTLSEEVASSFEDIPKMGIECSDGTTAVNTNGNSSTGEYGKRPKGQFHPDTLSTTSTGTSSTIGLKICAVCGALTTLKNTPFTRQQQNGAQPMPEGRENTGSKGRWPSNVIHDGSAEVEAAFAAFGESRSIDRPRHIGDFKSVSNGAEKAHITFGHSDTGTASRFFYAAKADATDRFGSKHPTVKPLDLMRYLVRLVTPPGGTILDPFAGSGTTGEAAQLEGFDAVLIEREAEYVTDTRRRLGRASGDDTPLFAGMAP